MKILRYEDLLNDKVEPGKSVCVEAGEESDDSRESDQKVNLGNVKGRRKSGKFWKDDRNKMSSIVKTRGLRLSLAKKRRLQEELKRVKEMSRQVVQHRKEEKEARRRRREENIKRRDENQKKAEVVQVIKNPAKIKRMRRKQLRRIEKRDTSMLQKK